jgi:molybdopterin-guanine dinucleotide biosynthesis protein A
MIDALVLAGGIPSEGQPLYPLTRGQPKALLLVAGKPMAQWVLDALAASTQVRRAVVVGLDGGLRFPRELAYVPNHGSMLDNVHAGAQKILELDPGAGHLLVLSSDIPSVQGVHIDWVIARALTEPADFSYCVIEQQAMEGLFPGCRRTFFRFRDQVVCGGDMAFISTRLFSMDAGVWQRLTAARKSRWRTAAIIGLDVLALFLVNRLSIDEAVRRASRRLHVSGRAIRCPYPEIGMDVDKPFQLGLVEDLVRRRAAT